MAGENLKVNTNEQSEAMSATDVSATSKATQQKPLVIDGVTALGIRILLRLFQVR